MRRQEPAPALSRRDVLRRWEELEWWACVYCDAPFGPMVVAEVDHITPLARGGLHEWVNLAPACAGCNRAKSDLDMSDWLGVLAGQLDTEREVTVTQRVLRVPRHVHTADT
ncbi:HNH endonuclease signature motif containing protein [Streptomyces sp. EN16]|uniref:HNH endonuclease n=1 Tax=Streptomyces sp. EN16 TaxID=212773 RepID=UPI0009A06673